MRIYSFPVHLFRCGQLSTKMSFLPPDLNANELSIIQGQVNSVITAQPLPPDEARWRDPLVIAQMYDTWWALYQQGVFFPSAMLELINVQCLYLLRRTLNLEVPNAPEVLVIVPMVAEVFYVYSNGHTRCPAHEDCGLDITLRFLDRYV